MQRLSHEFTSRNVSPWGGIKLFHEANQKSGVPAYFSGGHWPFPENHRGYDCKDLIEQFMTATVVEKR